MLRPQRLGSQTCKFQVLLETLRLVFLAKPTLPGCWLSIVANEGLVVGIPDRKNVSCHPGGFPGILGGGPHPTLRLVASLFLETC